MLNGILDGHQFSQPLTPSVVTASTHSNTSLKTTSASHILSGRFNTHQHPQANAPRPDHLFEGDDDDILSVSSSEGCFKPLVLSDYATALIWDSPSKQGHSKFPVLKGKLINPNHNSNTHISTNRHNNSNYHTGPNQTSNFNNSIITNSNLNHRALNSTHSTPASSTSSLPLNPSVPPTNGSAPNKQTITTMNSSSSLASNSSSTNGSNTVSNSNSNSSLRLGTSHAHHSSHGHHPLFHSSNYSSSSAINGSRQQQEMKRHLNRVRNEQCASGSGSNSSPANSNPNSATNSYIDSDSKMLRHYSSVGSNGSFKSTDDEMSPASAPQQAGTSSSVIAGSNPVPTTSVSRKLSDSSSIGSPLRVNSASSLRMTNSIDSQLGSNNVNNNINNNGNLNNSAPSSANNTSNNVGAMIPNSTSPDNMENIPNHSDPVALDSKQITNSLPFYGSGLSKQLHAENVQSSQSQVPTSSFSTSPQIYSPASQPVAVPSAPTSTSQDPQISSSFGYSTPGFTKNQTNGRVNFESIRPTNTSRAKRFGRGLGPPMRAPKRESEEGLSNNSAVTPPLPTPPDDLNKKPSVSSIKDREMVDVNSSSSTSDLNMNMNPSSNDLNASVNGSSQSKSLGNDGDFQMPCASTTLPPKSKSFSMSLDNHMPTDEDSRNGSEALPPIDIVGALKQHQQTQDQQQKQQKQQQQINQEARSSISSFQSNQGNYFGPSGASSVLENAPQSLPQFQLQHQIPIASSYSDGGSGSVALEDKIERELTLERQHEELYHYLQLQEKLIQDQQQQILMQNQQKQQIEEEHAKARAKAEAEAKAAQEQEQQNKQQANNAAAAAAAAAAASSGRKQKNLIYVNSQPYQRLELIGRGGSSKVYKAQSSTGKIYAIKRVSCDEDIDDTVLKGFKGEIDLLQRLNDEDRVVKLIDYEMRATSIYVVMECGEIDLAHVLNARLSLPLDISFVRYYANEMFRCVEAVHRHDIVHSDLKPANFLLVKGMLKIIDFGIANVVPDYTSNVHRDTQIGTPNYMAPEALLDASHVYANVSSSNSSTHTNRDEESSTNPNFNYRNSRNSIQSIASINPTPQKPKTTKFKVGRPSDVWSCGCIIYQMIYGRPPYGAYQGTQRMLAIMNPKVAIAYPRQGLGQIKVPKEVIEAIKGCLDRDPTQRLTIEQVVNGTFLNPQAVDRRFIHDLLGHAVKYGADRGNSVTARELEMLTENVWKKIQASNM